MALKPGSLLNPASLVAGLEEAYNQPPLKPGTVSPYPVKLTRMVGFWRLEVGGDDYSLPVIKIIDPPETGGKPSVYVCHGSQLVVSRIDFSGFGHAPVTSVTVWQTPNTP